MLWYLLAAGLYLAAAVATSFPVTAGIMMAGKYTAMDQMDREDWTLLAAAAALWPLTWLVFVWHRAATAYLRADTRRRLRGLGADIEEEDPDRG